MSVAGHLWTVSRVVARRQPPEPPDTRPWSLSLDDPRMGTVRLTGRLTEPPGARALVVAIHGIAGCAASSYVVAAARAARQAGLACLRINLRGCDREGEDYYHAALGADLGAALASPEVAGYWEIHLLGYSLGGHVALTYATGKPDPRLAAVAAVCTPLDLDRASRHLDRRSSWPYRRYVLGRMKEIYAAVAARRPVPMPMPQAARISTMRAWDEAVVAPRWGYAGAEDYYHRASVAPRLGRLPVPALLVMAEGDPMVPPKVVRPVLAEAPAVEGRWVPRGGHVAFPEDLTLGMEAPPGLASQALAWLTSRRRCGGPAR